MPGWLICCWRWGEREISCTIGGAEKLDGEFAPDVTILKPVKGVDPRMYAGLVSHCRQQYAGSFEIIFGVSSLDDPAVGEIERLRAEFPSVRYGWWSALNGWARRAR